MQWFRFYSEAIRDTKLRRIARDVGQPLPYVIGVWATVLSIASESPERGVLLVSKNIPATIDDISDAAGCNVSETFQKLLVTGLVTSHVTEGETVYSVASCEKRQYDTDSSTERVRKWRESQKNAQSQADETLQKRFSNAPDTDTDTDTDTDRGVSSGKERVVAPPSAGAQAPAPKPPKKSPKTPPPPEIETVRAITGRYPDKVLWPQIIATISSSGKDSEYIGSLYTTWRSRGYSPTNYAWLLEWLPNGIPTTNGKGKAAKLPSGLPAPEHLWGVVQAEIDRVHSYGTPALPDQIMTAIQAVGGWYLVCKCDPEGNIPARLRDAYRSVING